MSCQSGLHGWEVTDLKVTFTQAEYYSPVSTPADFRQLTPYVFRLALQQSGVDILEPMLCFELQIPQEASSKAITDLQKMMSEIDELLQAMDIFLFPSIYEGMPLSVVEAQASGLPCIISDAVTKMVNIGEDVIQLPLSKGADYWAEYLGNVKYELSRQERCERNTELITKAGYNIETEAENLMRIYKNL